MKGIVLIIKLNKEKKRRYINGAKSYEKGDLRIFLFHHRKVSLVQEKKLCKGQQCRGALTSSFD